MMKKGLLLCLLLLSLLLPAALAEETAPYAPGRVTENLFAGAFESGDMILLSGEYSLTLNENADVLLGEDAAVLRAAAQALENAAFTVGAGRIDNGLRVLLAGSYAADAGSADLSVTLDATGEGVALMSSVMPEDRITAKWETLLALAGLTDEEAASILSLRDTDLEALLSELAAQLAPFLEMAAQIAAPYVETIMAHIAALPMAISENVPAEYGYPAAAAEIQLQVTAKAVGDLITALAQQLRQDATLCAMIDTVLAEAFEADAAVTTAQLCDALIQAAAQELTDETMPLNIFIGMDEAGNLLYLNIISETGDGSYFTINYIAGQLEDTGASLINLDVLTLTAAQEILDGVSFVAAYDVDSANKNVMSLELLMGAYEGGAEIASFSFYADHAASADAQGGYAGLAAMTLDVLDGQDIVSMDMQADIRSFPTDGGEQMDVSGSIAISADGQELPLTFEAGVTTSAAGDTPASVLTETAHLPEFGVDVWRETYTLETCAQADFSALKETVLETASPETLQALADSAMTSLEQELTTLFELLPPELMALAQTQEEPAALPAQP